MNKSFKCCLLGALLFICSICETNAQTLKTPYGVLTVSNDSDLLLNQKQFSPNINGGMGIDFKFSTKYGDKFAVLISLNSGGNACPATYKWVLLSEKGFEASPDFGNCSEEAKGSLVGNDLIVQAPRYGTAPPAKYSFNGIQLKENNKVSPEKIVAGTYGVISTNIQQPQMAKESARPAAKISDKDSELAWCAAYLTVYSTETKSTQSMEQNYKTLREKLGIRISSIYNRWKSCMGNDSSDAKNLTCRQSLGPVDQAYWEENLFAFSKAQEAYLEGGMKRLKANVQLKCDRFL